jgi:hypothetical protein
MHHVKTLRADGDSHGAFIMNDDFLHRIRVDPPRRSPGLLGKDSNAKRAK